MRESSREANREKITSEEAEGGHEDRSAVKNESNISSSQKEGAKRPQTKKNLQIDVENFSQESKPSKANIDKPAVTLEESMSNMGWNQVRLFLLSERLHSNKPLSQSLSTPRSPIKRLNDDLKEMTEEMLGEDREGLSIFERKPFQQFTGSKFKEVLKNKNLPNLLKIREEVLEFRHKTQVELMNQMMAKQKFSPRTFQNKRDELERWVTRERDEINKTKSEIERGWLRTADTIIKVSF
jgi:hypothetical protein